MGMKLVDGHTVINLKIDFWQMGVNGRSEKEDSKHGMRGGRPMRTYTVYKGKVMSGCM